MANEFLGLTVVVKLNSHPNTSLRGLVSNVEGQRLFLRNVFFPTTGEFLEDHVVHGSEIADIEVASSPASIGIAPPDQASAGYQTRTAVQLPTHKSPPPPPAFASQIPPVAPKSQSNFVDPAILSFARTPTERQESLATLSKPFSALNIVKSQELEDAKTAVDSRRGSAVDAPAHPGSLPANGPQPARKQGQNKRTKKVIANSVNQDDSSPELSRPGLQSDGWRKTPILQEHVSIEGQNSTRRRKGKKKRAQEAQKKTLNGWATEEATDVQELGDFDFAGNLSKFDKQAVFSKLRGEDTIASEDRLVSFNRVAPSGTFGGKNLHPTENVLERPRVNSPGSVDSIDELELGASTGSRPMRRATSRTSTRQPPSRKDSSNLLDNINTPPVSHLTRSHRPLNQKQAASQTTGSPNLRGFISPSSPTHLTPARRKIAFRYVETDRICPTMEPDFLDTVEELACTELGFDEDLLAENAARGIAEVALSAISPGGRRQGPNTFNPQPVVVILAGDHRTGARAIAAARHLKERRIRVVVSLTSTAVEGSRSYLTSQLRRNGSEVLTWKETSAYLKTLDAPPELIIDGLLGVDSTLSDMSAEDEKTAMDMIGWANKSRASVLSIDLPAGVDAVTGNVEVREGEPAEVRAKFVVSCGAPCVGLLRAIEAREDDVDDWRMFVCDVGINPAWRLALQRSREKRNHKGINFWSGWVLAIRFDRAEP